MATLYKAKEVWTGTLSSAIPDGTTTSFSLTSSSGLTNGAKYLFTIDRVDASGTKTPSKKEVIAGTVSGSNVINCIRGVEGTAQAHSSGAIVEVLFNAKHWNELIDYLETEHNSDGTHKSATVTTLKATGSEINTGTEDAKIVTPKAIKDAGLPYQGEATGSDIDTGTNQTKYVSAKAIADSKVVSTAKPINNNEAIQQKDSSGTARNILKVNSSNILEFGDSNLSGHKFNKQYFFNVQRHNHQPQSVPNWVETKIQLNSVVFDPSNMFDNSNYRINIPVTGYYFLSADLFIDSGSGILYLAMKKNHTIYIFVNRYDNYSGMYNISKSGFVYLQQGDYIELFGFQSSGSNRNMGGGISGFLVSAV